MDISRDAVRGRCTTEEENGSRVNALATHQDLRRPCVTLGTATPAPPRLAHGSLASPFGPQRGADASVGAFILMVGGCGVGAGLKAGPEVVGAGIVLGLVVLVVAAIVGQIGRAKQGRII